MYTFSVTPPPDRQVAAQPRRRVAPQLLGQVLVALAVAVALVALLGLVIGPRVLGYRTSVMHASTMAGSIDRGDVMISMPRSPDRVRVGDIITVEAPGAGHQLVTHRVLSATIEPDGRVIVQTKGDGNAAADPWQTTISDEAVWETAYVVPKIGHLVPALRSLVVGYGAVWVALGGVLLLGLNLVRGSGPRTRKPQQSGAQLSLVPMGQRR